MSRALVEIWPHVQGSQWDAENDECVEDYSAGIIVHDMFIRFTILGAVVKDMTTNYEKASL
jgi:hypothetical protein